MKRYFASAQSDMKEKLSSACSYFDFRKLGIKHEKKSQLSYSVGLYEPCLPSLRLTISFEHTGSFISELCLKELPLLVKMYNHFVAPGC